MTFNRRKWLQQIGLGVAGLTLNPLNTLVSSTHKLQPRVVSTDGTLHLSSNENPYGPSSLARKAMAESISDSNRYNWDLTGDLISAVAKKNSLKDENVIVAAGSTEILDVIVEYFANQKGSFVVAAPSYTGWSIAGEKLGLKKITIPLTAEKHHNLDAMLAAISPDSKFIYICNPNNPTATICERQALVSFINAATKNATVVIDEAYLEFSNEISVSNLVTENENLIVVKTFSKIYGLAGARVGYALAHKNTIEKISGMQTWASGGVSVVSRVGAIASLKDEEFVKQCKSKNEAARKYTVEQLTKLNIRCIPSTTNFIYFALENYKKDFFGLLKQHNIEGTDIYENQGKWTRITVGTMSEMQKFITAIQ